MKIALIGYGKMGKAIEKQALEKGYLVSVKIDPLFHDYNDTCNKSLQNVDLCIDFSAPNAVLKNIENAAKLSIPIVIGTTGWYDQIDEAKAIISRYNSAALWSPNFSLGVNLFLKIVQEACKIVNGFDDYDVSGFEIHHNQKCDSPSGTAMAIANRIIENITQKDTIVYDTLNRKINTNELHFTSLRVGKVPGTHQVIFDSLQDSITLTHEARNREGFAEGSLIAGEWLLGKKGFFQFQDIINFLGSR
jgi:4-hydroxy-tetrahydrodipicolinate reductase